MVKKAIRTNAVRSEKFSGMLRQVLLLSATVDATSSRTVATVHFLLLLFRYFNPCLF